MARRGTARRPSFTFLTSESPAGPLARHQWGLALASGVLLALAFPKFGHPAVAWVALVPWLVAVTGPGGRQAVSGGRAFLLGLVMAAAYFAGTLYWIPDVLVTFGGLSRALAIPVTGLLVAYLAIYPAISSWIVARAVGQAGVFGLWVTPFAWVATEWVRGWLFSGFPWVSLGYSQVSWLWLAQAASLNGVWGLSALVAAGNTALALLLIGPRRGWRGPAIVGALVVVLTTWGAWRVRAQGAPAVGTMRVGIVQGNVPQDQKWEPGAADGILQRYLRLSREAAAGGARLIVWPESSTPFYFEEDPVRAQAIRHLAQETRAWILFGSDQFERGPVPRYYNAAFLVSPDGTTAGVYRKRRLVPFGEYVPLKTWLFFVSPLVEAVADFSAGDDATPLPVNGHTLSTAICYEVVFGDLARDAVQAGSQLLTTVTNDAWYGRTSAPWQHFEQARLRAIEQGRYLVRAANTGVSGAIDARGRVIARSELFETGFLVVDVAFVDERTVYSRIGDSFAWACAALSLWVAWRHAPRPAR